MKIQINGNINEYYVQTLCMLFFPGVKFSKSETSENDSLSTEIIIADFKEGVTATVTLITENGTATCTHCEPKIENSKVSAEQIACGKAFFEAGKKLTGIMPSWGILTGVRPAKLAITDLNAGKTKKEVIDSLAKEYLVTPKKASLATEIADIEKQHRWLKNKRIIGVADPSIWDASRGEAIIEAADRNGVYFTKGDNKRLPGWMQVHYRLSFDENGIPMMYVFNTCKGFIRTVPELKFSNNNPEDLDTTGEDHIADEVRYMCMARPIAPTYKKKITALGDDPLNLHKGYYRTV